MTKKKSSPTTSKTNSQEKGDQYLPYDPKVEAILENVTITRSTPTSTPQAVGEEPEHSKTIKTNSCIKKSLDSETPSKQQSQQGPEAPSNEALQAQINALIADQNELAKRIVFEKTINLELLKSQMKAVADLLKTTPYLLYGNNAGEGFINKIELFFKTEREILATRGYNGRDAVIRGLLQDAQALLADLNRRETLVYALMAQIQSLFQISEKNDNARKG